MIETPRALARHRLLPARLGLAVLALACLGAKGCGDRWRPFNEGIEAVPIRGVAVAPSDPQQVTVLTGDGVYVSTDGGANWRLGRGLPADAWVDVPHLVPNALWRSPAASQRLFAQVQARLYRSDDFGRTWQPASGHCPDCTSTWSYYYEACTDRLAGVTLDPSDPDRLLAGTIVASGEGGVLTSSDGGGAWQWAASSAAEPHACEPRKARHLGSGTGPTTPLASGAELDTRPKLPCEAASPISDSRPGATRGCEPLPGMENDAWPLALDPDRPQVVMAGGPHPAADGGRNGLKISHDGGRSWVRVVDQELCRQPAVALIADPRAPRGWLASGLATYETADDGATWRRVEGLGAVRDFARGPEGELWALGSKLWHRAPQRDAWQEVALPAGVVPANFAVASVDGRRTLYVGTTAAGLHRRIAEGAWQDVSRGLPTRIELDTLRAVGGELVAAISGNGLWRRGAGVPWRPLGPRLGARYSDSWVAPDLRTAYWAGNDRLYRWREGETAWREIDVEWGDLSGHLWISRFRRHPTDPGTAVAIVQDTDDRHWELLRLRPVGDRMERLGATRLEGRNPYYGHVFPDVLFDGREILLASYLLGLGGDASGVQRSIDGGATFQRLLVRGLAGDDRSIHQLTAVDAAAGHYFMVTWGGRLFETRDDFATAEEVPSTVEWQGRPWANWVWSLDLESTAAHRFLARDWHDWDLYPEERPGRTRYAPRFPTQGPDWIELADAGLPRDAVALDQVPIFFLPWQRNVAVLATYGHGLWARKLP